MNLYPQYIDYNFVKIVIGDNYIITNVQRKGLPQENCQAHLESLEIESAVVGSNNPSECGAKGTVTVIDYKDSIFKVLQRNLVDYIKAKDSDAQNRNIYLPNISIHIECFTGVRDWNGVITDWQVQFVGTTPSITLTWSCIQPQTIGNAVALGQAVGAEYNGTDKGTPKDFLENLKNKDLKFSPNIPIVDTSGKEITGDNLKFTSVPFRLDLQKISTSQNKQIDIYNYFLSRVVTNDGKILVGRFKGPDKSSSDTDGGKFIVEYKEPTNNTTDTEEGSIQTKLVFVQNGTYKYYKERADKRIVIPMTSFNYDAKLNNMVLESRVLYNPNGTTVITASGDQQTKTATPNAPVQSANNGNSSNPENSGIAISFECYNVIDFSLNNTSEKVMYEIYNETGQKHIVSGMGTVTSCRFSVSGGVLKANVSCTEVFNNNITDESGEGTAKDADGNTAGDKQVEKSETAKKQEEMLYKDDEKIIPLEYDRTNVCIENGLFYEHVNTFLELYMTLDGAKRLIDRSFINELIMCGNFGLLSLLISVANYGVKDPDPAWGDDPVYSSFSQAKNDAAKRKPYYASNIGKTPDDFDKGGLGICHWDDANLKVIYTTCGFRPGMTKDYYEELANLIVLPRQTDVSSEIDFKGWKSIKYKGIDRLAPIFTKEAVMRQFDKGLRQNTKWVDWAEEIVNYKMGEENPKYPYQEFLFKLWVDKFWTYTARTLLAKKGRNKYIPSLQDLVRISRIGNSNKGLVDKVAGLPPKVQVETYCNYREPDRRRMQMMFCARTNKILEAELL